MARTLANNLEAAGYYPPEFEYDIFHQDKEANKFRSAAFQSILMAAAPKGQKEGQAEGGAVQTYNENRKRVEQEILHILRSVCPQGISEEMEAVVTNIVHYAGRLALEFGSQRAELGLDAPKSGETVQIGQGFADCENGDGKRGTEEVDLLVSPKLYRKGDGRNDLQTEKVIFAGEIYPRLNGYAEGQSSNW